MSLIIGAIPIAVVGLILRKATQLRHAPSWPSTRARIIKSEPRPVHRCRNGVTQVVSVPVSNTNSASAIASFARRESRSARWPVQAPRKRLTDIPWAARFRSIPLVAIALVFFGLGYSFPARSARDSRVFR